MTLLVCPFCREVYPAAERDTCPDCGVLLRGADDLPATAPDEDAPAPEDVPFRWYSPRAGRGVVLGLSMLGLGSYFTPWLTLTGTERHVLSGFALVAERGFWFSGGAVGFGVLFALVFSRRTLHELAGVRVISALLASVAFFQALLLSTFEFGPTPMTSAFAPGFYATAVTSLVLALATLKLGRGRSSLR